ncbi:CheY-like chemotaxis protein [Bradyrhizobium sp. LM2.7]|nr:MULTISPECIES: response regulator [unclassified Bradyrhizobium]MCK1714304.1 response regulator [Bradyrhizobium sp. 143]MCK1726924.1 response regulator [Bradyrhizobium sp. 142]
MQHRACTRPLVLVVEDDILLRWTAAEALQAAGFDVIEAGSAIEAISILEKRVDIRAVFTDVQMPGSIDGLKLAHLISFRWPPIRIIATSGKVKLRDDDLPEGGRYLQKPYPMAELTGLLGEMMGQ